MKKKRNIVVAKKQLPRDLVITEVSRDKKNPEFEFSQNFNLLMVEPGAGNPLYSYNDGEYQEVWLKEGFGGCTKEAGDTDKKLKEYVELGVDVYIVNTMSADENQQAAISKGYSANLKFLSDDKLELGTTLGFALHNFSEEKQHHVYRPHIYLFNKEGMQIWDKVVDRKTDAAESIFNEVSDVVKLAKDSKIQAHVEQSFIKNASLDNGEDAVSSLQNTNNL